MTDRHTAFAEDRHTASESETASSRGSDLRRAVSLWLSDGKAQGWTRKTLDDRRATLDRFLWWLHNEQEAALALRSLTPATIRAFLTYARDPRPEGRFGCSRSSAKREARPATVSAYFRILRAFSNWCIEEGLMDSTPLKNVKAPKVPKDQIVPFTGEQVQQLLDAARRRSRFGVRDVALILTLVDTGMRESELMKLTVADVDRGDGKLRVTGKGNKRRMVCLGTNARRALWRYLETPERQNASPGEPLFTSIGGHTAGGALTATGVYEIVRRAGDAADIQGVRASPHTLRHTFAVTFLRNGGNLFELQALMGHEDLTILRRYVALAEQDLSAAHRAASPGDRLRLR